jgi:hypothetical protein
VTAIFHSGYEQKRRKQRDFLYKALAFVARRAERAIVWDLPRNIPARFFARIGPYPAGMWGDVSISSGI